jgi:hypothetical protein
LHDAIGACGLLLLVYRFGNAARQFNGKFQSVRRPG